MASAIGIIDRMAYKAMPEDVKYELEGTFKRHVGEGVYRGRYPDPAAVTASLQPGRPDTFIELTVGIDWENLPRHNAPEDWHRTENGTYVPKADLTKDEAKTSLPIPEFGPTAQALRIHALHIAKIIRISLSEDPIWDNSETGWCFALENGFDPSKKLGVLVNILDKSMWDATYSGEDEPVADQSSSN